LSGFANVQTFSFAKVSNYSSKVNKEEKKSFIFGGKIFSKFFYDRSVGGHCSMSGRSVGVWDAKKSSPTTITSTKLL